MEFIPLGWRRFISKADASLEGRSGPWRQELGVGLKQKLRPWEWMSSCKTVLGEKEMGLRTESWRTLTVVVGEEQKERGSRKKWSFQRGGGGSLIFSLFSSATPLTSQEVCGGGGRPRGTLVPAQPPECSQVKGSQASDWSAWVLELVGTGEVRQGGLPPPSPFLAV